MEQILVFVGAIDKNNAIYKTVLNNEYIFKIAGKDLVMIGKAESLLSGAPKLVNGMTLFDTVVTTNGFDQIDLQTTPATPNDFTRDEGSDTLTISSTGVTKINNSYRLVSLAHGLRSLSVLSHSRGGNAMVCN